MSHIVTYNRELQYLDIWDISKHVTYLVLQIHHKFVTPKYHPLLCRFVVTQYWDEFHKAICEMAVRDMILTPIMCFGSYKIIWEGLEPFGKTTHFLCWNWSVAVACGSETSGRGHRPKLTKFSVFSIFVEQLKKPK